MEETIIHSGRFQQSATKKNINLAVRSDVDWIYTYNMSNIPATAVAGVAEGYKFYWQRYMASESTPLYGIEYKGTAGSGVVNMLKLQTDTGFKLINSTDRTPLKLDGIIGDASVNNISTDPTPLVTNLNKNYLKAGDVVRLFSLVDGTQLAGIDFEVGSANLTDTTFELVYGATLTVATGAGHWKQIPFDPVFYPRYRYITKITTGASTVVTFSVTHGYKVGQTVRFSMGSYPTGVSYCKELDGLLGNIIDVDTANNTITVDINSTAFSAFTLPTHTQITGNGFSPSMCIPIGNDTATSEVYGVDIHSASTVNESYLGIRLAAGADSPAGEANDVIYWVAGKNGFVDDTGSLVR